MPDLWERANAGDPQACFDLGLRYNHEGRLRRGRRWLERSAAGDFTSAHAELGLVYLHGLGVEPNPNQAAEHFELASKRNHAEASFQLANLQYSGLGCTQDRSAALAALLKSARLEFEPALQMLAVIDPSFDVSVRTDWSWPSNRQLQRHPLSADPRLDRVSDALSGAECAHLIQVAKPMLQPSLTIDPVSGSPKRNLVRTSSGTSLGAAQEDIVIVRIKERLATLAGLDASLAESFALLRYGVGEEYRPHHDYIDVGASEDRYQLRRYGQRQATVFCYLNSVSSGGETAFPRLGIRQEPLAGNALYFSNVDATGEPDPRTLHASLPVKTGEKWLATLWFRERSVRETSR